MKHESNFTEAETDAQQTHSIFSVDDSESY